MQRVPAVVWRFATQTFLLIAEPRVIRVVQFGVYLCMVAAGLFVLTTPPWSLRDVLGEALVAILGGFITGGAVLGVIAVLPGIWWLERSAILALGTGLAMYSVVIVNLGAPVVGFLVGFAFILCLVQRWMEIRKFQLAPKRG